jgi:hypothetical protein
LIRLILIPFIVFISISGCIKNDALEFRDIEDHLIYFETKGKLNFFADYSPSIINDGGTFINRRFVATSDTSKKNGSYIRLVNVRYPSEDISNGFERMNISINFGNLYLTEGTYELTPFNELPNYLLEYTQRGIKEKIIYADVYYSDYRKNKPRTTLAFLSKRGTVWVSNYGNFQKMIEFEITLGEKYVDENYNRSIGSELKVKGRYITGTNYD